MLFCCVNNDVLPFIVLFSIYSFVFLFIDKQLLLYLLTRYISSFISATEVFWPFFLWVVFFNQFVDLCKLFILSCVICFFSILVMSFDFKSSSFLIQYTFFLNSYYFCVQFKKTLYIQYTFFLNSYYFCVQFKKTMYISRSWRCSIRFSHRSLLIFLSHLDLWSN